MKIEKQELLTFLNRIYVKGLNDAGSYPGATSGAVIEKDGSVTLSIMNELIIAGQSDILKFDNKTAITNLNLLIKIISSLSGDNILLDINDQEMQIEAKKEKYAFRLADPSVLDSLYEKRDKINKMKDEFEKLTLSKDVVSTIRKAINNLSAERVSFYVNDGILELIVNDDNTKSYSTIELGKIKSEFKNDYNGMMLSKILEIVGNSECVLSIQQDKPLFIELEDKKFVYMLSFIQGDQED